jgi:ribonuclease E
MKKEMLINVAQVEECRIAILEDGVLEELSVERTSHESYVGNIYKGRIVNIEPSIQAAFVDFGIGRNGFLHVSDVEPAYFRHLEPGGRREDRNGERGERRNGGRGRERDRDTDRSRSTSIPSLPTFTPPPSPAELSSEASSSGPVVEEPQPGGFGAGIFTDPEPALPPPPAEVLAVPSPGAPEEPMVQESAEAIEPLTALPETQIEEEPARRKRSRSGGRKKKGASNEPAPEEDDPKPPLMDSTEHRTTDRDPTADPLETGADGGGEDDLLFFPRSNEPPPPPVVQEPEPEPQPEPEPEPFVPPVRPRPTVRSHRSIEDDLRADLAAADIDDVPESGDPVSAPARPERSERPQRDRPEREERPLAQEEAPAAEREVDEEVGYESSFPDEEDVEDEGPPRREGPGERRGSRERGRPGGRDRGRGGRPGRGPGMGRPKPLIQDIFRRGQEVLVQVIKDGIGTKGPTLSTYLAIAGRYLVLMPGLNRTGVSKKIVDEDQRRRLREMFNELRPPKGLGFIMRTAAGDRNKKELQRDLAYLSRLWQVMVRRIKKLKSPCEIYQESDIITRTIRDTFTSTIDTILVDEPTAFEAAQEFLQVVMPRYADRIKLYNDPEPLFHRYGIEEEIARIQLRKVPLPMGGSIVIEQTEALVAIDVNSGNFRAERNDAEETAYQMNLHAAREIARQLRLRDLGGVIVNDFIDMRDEKKRRNVEKALRDAMRRDRARTKILKTSAFGLIEMTRQRMRPSLKRNVSTDCPYCHGTGQVKTVESMSLEVMRLLQLAAHREHVVRIEIRVAAEVAAYLLNRKRLEITRLEQGGGAQVQVSGALNVPPELLEFVCLDNNNNEVKFLNNDPPGRPRR